MRNLKKVVALIAVFAMMVSTVAFAATFNDVAESDNYYEAIETLNKLGIITGDDNDNDGVMSFRPADSITRAEIAVIVARIQGQTGAVAQTNTVFTDVPSTHWASGYIASATNMGIVNGYGDGTFGPEDNVLYEDVIKMLMETLGYKPYAASNGGYPTGYILAAQRQEVLVGVVGGAEGTQATRGQVAQMTKNAIDTPLMEKYTYGGSDQYVIWDGESWSPRRTLMSTALGVNKIRGLVVENDVTGLDSAVQIDTDSKSQVRVYVEDNYLGSNDTTGDYEVGSTYSFYTGETDANDYLGYDVVLYAKDSSNDTDEIVSITEAANKNTKLEITLDKYDSFEAADGNTKAQLGYMRNETDRSATKVRIDNDADIIYNGVAYTSGISNMFGNDAGEGLVYPDSAYSGKITLLDNDDESGYDVVFVDVAVAAVVDEVTARGVAMFKNAPGSKTYKNSISKIDFDSSNTDIKIEITKDGQPFDYTALNEWDVLSVVANNVDANGEYYRISVLGDTAVTGTVARTSASTTSSDGTSYTIDGVEYDLAEGAYTNGTLRAGAYGTFYIDDNGKIVAYNKQGSAAQASDNYAYVVNAKLTSDGFDENIPTLQIVYKDGSVNTVYFSSTVTIDNPSAELYALAGDGDTDQITFKYDNYKSKDGYEEAIQSMSGQVVTLSANSGNVKQITLASDNKVDTSSLVLEKQSDEKTASYDEDTKEITVAGKKYDVADDALVFFVGKTGSTAAFGAVGGVSVDDCTVSTGAALQTNNGFAAALYSDGVDNDITVIVMYNTDAGIGASTGLAYVVGIGKSTVDGSNVLSVEYYQDGELKTSYTDEISVSGVLDQSTVAGSLFKFGMTGDTITSAVPYLTFDGSVRDKLTSSSDLTKSGMPNADIIKTTSSNADEDLYYGAVVKKDNQRITIASVTEDNKLPNLSETTSVNLAKYSTVNCYLYDPARSGKAKFQLATVGDIYADRQLTNDNGKDTPQYEISLDGSTFYEAPAWGMLDYVYVRTFDTKADVIDYAAWEYDYEAASVR